MIDIELDELNEKKKTLLARIEKYELNIVEAKNDLNSVNQKILEITDLRELAAFRAARDAGSLTPEFMKLVGIHMERLAFEAITKPKRGRKKKTEAAPATAAPAAEPTA